MRTVKDILAQKPRPLNTIEPRALVIDALRKLNEVNLSYLIVMEGDKYEGIFSERDYSRNVLLKGRSSEKTPVNEVMTTDVPHVEMNETVEHCMNLMTEHSRRYLVAFNNGHFAGVITIHDLLRQVMTSKEHVFDHDLTQKLIDVNESGGRIY
jgi:signal-transduction protein with cAMP-binding, CBS, and nucleotidyltransferase domain